MECPAAVDGHEDWLGLVDGFAAVALMNRGLNQGGLPLVLVLTLTFYRAKPVWMELCGDVPSDLDLLPLSKAHRVILCPGKQFGLFLLDIVTLPCLILVLCTWYRYRHMRHKQEQLRQRSESGSSKAEVPAEVAYHWAVLVNAMVVLHDLLLVPLEEGNVICSSSLLLSVYRLPKLYRLLTAEVDEALTRDTYDWDLRGKIWEEISLVSRMVFFLASKSFCRNRLSDLGEDLQEIGELCLDVPLLPFLLILLFTLWRSDVVLQEIWKAEDNCARRRVVLCQFLELLRDTLGFGALLILVATLVRLPKAGQVSGEPRLTLRRVRLVSPDAALQADGRLSVQVEGQQLEQEEMGVIRINVISKSFWDEIGRAFGSSEPQSQQWYFGWPVPGLGSDAAQRPRRGEVASLGRALLPYPLKDGKHLKYQDLLNAEVFFELKMGGRELKTKLMQLNAQMAMCVQLELLKSVTGNHQKPSEPRSPRDPRHRTPKGTDEILARLPLPTRFLQEAVRSPGTFVEDDHPQSLTLGNSLGYVPEELLHASAEEVCGPLLCGSGIRNALFFFLVLALAPWRMLQCAYFAARPSQEQQLKIYRQGLEPLLNAAAKDPARIKPGAMTPAERTPEQLQRVVKQQQAKSPVISLKAHRWAELQANESTAHFVDRATAYSSLLDAEASYWPGLILGTNLQLTQECINPHEHALALEKIMAAQALAEEISSKLAREVQAACDELNTEEHKGVSVCRGLCSKSLQEQRHLVRVFVLDMLKDYGFRERLRVVLNFQMRCLVRDLWMLISTFLCSLAALITLVRALEFLQSAFLYCKNLADLREAALKSTAEAFNSMWELFMLLTLWETYGTLVRATICAVLIPAWGLRCLPHWLRIVFWLSLTALPWLLSFQHALWSYGIILLLFFLLGLWKDGAAARPTPAYLKTLRVTSVNALILLSIVAEPVLLTALVVGVGVSESSATPSTRRLLQSEGSFAAAAAVTLCWLIVMSLPHVMSSESSCLGTVRFHVAMQFLRRACLPAAVVFLAQDGSRGAVSLLLLGFLSFTTILGLDLLSQRHLPDTVNLDLVQPAAFLAGSIFTQAHPR
ncbi:Uncharacterized protein SCF082_LOCUS7933 [Durusdinium trenchii]|uniref:Uncharacterized protein n=1 Tax=Durusdinium trenchii TaxID=1381693 RepID=A0ABP0IRA3_9DINO